MFLHTYHFAFVIIVYTVYATCFTFILLFFHQTAFLLIYISHMYFTSQFIFQYVL